MLLRTNGPRPQKVDGCSSTRPWFSEHQEPCQNQTHNQKKGTASDPASGGTELKECLVCGAVGLPERITNHDCEDFLDHKDLQG